MAAGLLSGWCTGMMVNLSSTSVGDKEPYESSELAAKHRDPMKEGCLCTFLYKQISVTENAFIRSFCSACLCFPFLLFSPGCNRLSSLGAYFLFICLLKWKKPRLPEDRQELISLLHSRSTETPLLLHLS